MAKKGAPMGKGNVGKTSSKTSAKGAHGGGIKFGQVVLGSGFKTINKGINKAKSAAKLPKPKNNISESTSPLTRPPVSLGNGFGTNPYLRAEAKAVSKKWGQSALKKAAKPPSKGGTKGSLRRMMGKGEGEKITRSELKAVIDNPRSSAKKKQKALAIYNLGGGAKGKNGK